MFTGLEPAMAEKKYSSVHS